MGGPNNECDAPTDRADVVTGICPDRLRCVELECPVSPSLPAGLELPRGLESCHSWLASAGVKGAMRPLVSAAPLLLACTATAQQLMMCTNTCRKFAHE